MTDDELEVQPPARPLTSRRTGGAKPLRMAKPIETGLKEITPEPPQPRAAEPSAPPEPTLDLTPDEPYGDDLVEAAPVEPASRPAPEVFSDPEPEAKSEPAIPVEPEPDTPVDAAAEPESSVPPASLEPPATSSAAEPDLPATVRETLRVVDESWRAFHAMAARFPSERMDERLGEDAWTRKQMLFHVAAWHDLTADRLIKFFNTGKPAEFDQDTDRFNAVSARRAIGKTAGEVLNDTEATFNRLRRQMQRLSDPQLRQFDGWAAWVIRANTYGHYEEHWQDVYIPEPPPGTGQRR